MIIGMVFEVPIKFGNPEIGSIIYHSEPEELNGVDGFFSFTLYIRAKKIGEPTLKDAVFYLFGLSMYKKLLESDPFRNWKLLIYTDTYTLDLLRNSKEYKAIRNVNFDKYLYKPFAQELLDKENIVFAEVKWPFYERKNGIHQINGPILRTFRSRAPFDFPDKLIFIRDADTLFDETLNKIQGIGFGQTAEGILRIYEKEKKEFVERLLEWEIQALRILPSIEEYLGNIPIVLGAGYAGRNPTNTVPPLYKRKWHGNEFGEQAPFGVFAGLINIAPNIPIYKRKEIWDSFIEYLLKRSHPVPDKNYTLFNREFEKIKNRYGNDKSVYEADLEAEMGEEKAKKYIDFMKKIIHTYSNNEKIHRIGRDEQFYLLFILPNARENIYFLRTDLEDLVPPVRNNEFNRSRKRNLVGGRKNTRKAKKTRKQITKYQAL
jgi:hypothetical protein